MTVSLVLQISDISLHPETGFMIHLMALILTSDPHTYTEFHSARMFKGAKPCGAISNGTSVIKCCKMSIIQARS